MAQSVEELEAQAKAEQEALDATVEEAAVEAGEVASASGASPEDVKKAVEKARKEEKDKLYPQLEALKSTVKEVQELLKAEKQEKENIKKAAEESAEAERQAKLSASEKQLEAIKNIEEKLEQERVERQRLERETKAAREADEVRRYRNTVLEAAGDEIIPDLVTGGTKEEIDTSAVIAKARYEELAERFKTKAGDQVRKGLSSTSPDTEALEEEELERSLSQVDQDKYMKDPEYRERIQLELESAYQRAMGR